MTVSEFLVGTGCLCRPVGGRSGGVLVGSSAAVSWPAWCADGREEASRVAGVLLQDPALASARAFAAPPLPGCSSLASRLHRRKFCITAEHYKRVQAVTASITGVRLN
jgi:hypothetical protein